MPRLTVILPVHNGARYIREALASVVGQTFPDWELLVVDDGSTDESCRIAESVGDPRIRILTMPVRGGICAALNHGLRNADSPLIARMDADDRCEPDRFARQAAFLKRHSDVDVCGSWVTRFDGLGWSRLYIRPATHDRIRAHMLFDNPMVHSSVMMRRRMFDDGTLAYDPDYGDAEDYDLWSRAMAQGCRFANIPRSLLQYRVHEKSVTYLAKAGMDEKACRVVARLLEPLGLSSTPEEILFHRHLGTGRLYPARNREAIERAEAWLRRLLEANRTRSVYPAAAFARAVSEVWYQTCYHSLSEGAWMLKRYLAFQYSAIGAGNVDLVGCFLGASIKAACLPRSAQ